MSWALYLLPGKIFELMAEIFGKESGICKGRGGSQHLHHKNFYSNGILGGSVPQAVGASLAIKGSGGITIVFIGDGTMGEGVLYECLNICLLGMSSFICLRKQFYCPNYVT